MLDRLASLEPLAEGAGALGGVLMAATDDGEVCAGSTISELRSGNGEFGGSCDGCGDSLGIPCSQSFDLVASENGLPAIQMAFNGEPPYPTKRRGTR